MEHFFLPIKTFEGHYAVSDTGLVKSLSRVTTHGRRRNAKILKSSKVYGYEYVSLSKDGKKSMRRVHRLVAEAFLPNPLELPHVHHIDHQRDNNHLENLRWVDAYDNMGEASRAGRLDGQSRGFGTQLNRQQVAQIRARAAAGETSETLGPEFGVTGRTVRHILSGDTWSGPRGGLN